MKLAIGCDEAAYELKQLLKQHVEAAGHEVTDFGTFDAKPVLYPDIAFAVAEQVAAGAHERGLLLCGTGIGMAISANKVKGVRAAVAWNEEIARLARQHNNANVLSLAARYTSDEENQKIVKAWFATDFEGGRHERRVEKIGQIEKDDLA